MPHDDIYSAALQKKSCDFFVNGGETVIVFISTIVLGRPICSACVLVA